jgi:hypothetical protein
MTHQVAELKRNKTEAAIQLQRARSKGDLTPRSRGDLHTKPAKERLDSGELALATSTGIDSGEEIAPHAPTKVRLQLPDGKRDEKDDEEVRRAALNPSGSIRLSAKVADVL